MYVFSRPLASLELDGGARRVVRGKVDRVPDRNARGAGGSEDRIISAGDGYYPAPEKAKHVSG